LKEKILVPETHPGIDEKEDPYFKAVENIDDEQGFVNHAREATELPPSFFDSSRFTLSLSQIIEFCTSDPSSFDHFDRLDRWGVKRKNPLNPVTHRNLTDREGGTQAVPLDGNDHSFEDLNPGLVSLSDFHIDSNRVSGSEFRHLPVHILFFNFID